MPASAPPMEKKAKVLEDYNKWDRISILKINSQNKVLYGAEYKVETYYGKSIPGKLRTNDSGTTTFILDKEFFSSFENAASILPDNFRNELNSYVYFSDFENGSLYENFHYTSGSSTKEILLYIPVKIIETKAPAGYKKLDMTTFLIFNVVYKYDDGTFTIQIDHNAALPVFYGHLDFDSTNLSHYQYEYVFSYNNSNNADILDRRCGDEIISGPSTFSDNYCSDFAYYFENEEGEVKLTIEDTVNGVKKYDATTDKKLKYKIEVKNTGNAGSGNNVIVTHVPEEIEVLSDNISDSGEYNKSNHTITWNVDFIDEGETISLEYQATAPGEVLGEQLVGHSEVSSEQVTTTIKSSDTIVVMTKASEAVNPNTASPVFISYTDVFGLIMLLLATIIFIIYYKNKYKIKRHI